MTVPRSHRWGLLLKDMLPLPVFLGDGSELAFPGLSESPGGRSTSPRGPSLVPPPSRLPFPPPPLLFSGTTAPVNYLL